MPSTGDVDAAARLSSFDVVTDSQKELTEAPEGATQVASVPPPVLSEPPEPRPEPEWFAIPPPRMEWVIAAMFGIGIALAVAGLIAFIESQRFGPAPPKEVGAKEWVEPKPRPPKTHPADSVEIGSASAAASDLELEEEPAIDVNVHGSASSSSSSSQ